MASIAAFASWRPAARRSAIRETQRPAELPRALPFSGAGSLRRKTAARMRLPLSLVGVGVGCAVALCAGQVRADTQLASGVLGGAAHVRSGEQRGWRPWIGLRADALLLRERDADMGVGPYLEIMTGAGERAQLGTGASLLLPVHTHLPLVLSGGAYAALGADSAWRPGIAADLFWGPRSVNFHAPYGMANGVVVGLRSSLGLGGTTAISAGLRLDLELLALPFLLAWNAVR